MQKLQLIAPGVSIDRYVIRDRIGEGGMATVYEVEHAVLGTRHALKVLHSNDAALGERLLREGRLQAHLDPAYIVPVTDVIEIDGAPALVMPLVDGCSLSDLLRDHRPTHAEVGAIFTSVVAGVASAHDSGVVHRDLKPANVLLEVKHGQVQIRVADFGVARAVDADHRRTRAGAMMGTPAYAAPEQINDASTADHRADLWSLGVMLFEMLTGTRPFQADNLGSLFRACAEGDYDRAAVPVPWRGVVDGLLQPDRTDRIGSTSELIRRLAGTVEPVSLVEGSPIAEVVRLRLVGRMRERAEATFTVSLDNPQVRSAPQEYPVPFASFSVSAASVSLHSLPRERDLFVGRERELDLLHHLVEGAGRLVSVLGIGGSGKTRLVTRFGWKRLVDYPGGVWFCDLSDARSVEGIAYAVATALSVPLGKSPVQQLGHAMAGRGRCLIILDNFEQVARYAAATLGKWLDRGGQARFVVTSREVLGLSGERSLLLAPLDGREAVDLFTARAASAKRDFVVSADDQADVRALVTLLDGLPLAIELAASRVRAMSPKVLLKRMSQRFKLLSSIRGRGDRQSALRATLDWSWDLLAVDEQAALAQISVFEGGFTLDAAEAVLSLSELWPVDAVQALVDKSLVRQVAHERFDVLMSVREYAVDKLDALAMRASTEASHGTWYATHGSRAALDSLTWSSGRSLRRALVRDAGNLHLACQTAVQRGDGQVAAATLRAVWAVLKIRGPVVTGGTLAELVLSMPGLTAHDRASASTCAGQAQGIAGNLGEARAHFEAALDGYRDVGDRRFEAFVQSQLGDMCRTQGRLDEALTRFASALALYGELDDRRSVGMVTGYRGIALAILGRTDEAMAHFNAALLIHRELDNRESEGIELASMGNLAGILGSTNEALKYFEAALVVHREVGNRRLEGSVLGNLGITYATLGRTDEALRYFDRSLSMQRDVGDRHGESSVLDNLGSLHREAGRTTDAHASLTAALAIHVDFDNSRSQAITLGQLSLVASSTGRLEQALSLLNEARSLLDISGDRFALGLHLCDRVQALHVAVGDTKQVEAARAALVQAEVIAEELVAGPESPLGRRIEEVRPLVELPDTSVG